MAEFSCGAFVNVTSFNPADWERQLREVDELSGLDHVELWLEFTPSTREVETIASVFAERSVIMHGPFIGTSFASEWGDLVGVSLDRCRRAIEVAAFLECKVVTLHGGSYGAFGEHSERLEQVAAIVAELALIKEPRVTIENMATRGGASREAVGSLRDLEELCEAVPDLSITLDVGHCLENGEEFAGFLRDHAQRIANIHLHDGAPGTRSHKRLGAGSLDVDELLRLLAEVDYRAFLTLETIGAADTAFSWEVLTAKMDRVVERAG